MSNLPFKERVGETVVRFRSFYGRNIHQMPLLLSGKDAEGKVVDVPRVPITPKQVLYERIHGKEDKVIFQDSYIETACAVLMDPSGSGAVKIARYDVSGVRDLIHAINPQIPLSNGAYVISQEQYEAIAPKDAFMLDAAAANELFRNAYGVQKKREAWEYLAEGDTKLVQDHLQLIESRFRSSMGARGNIECMGLFISSTPGMRLLGLSSVNYVGVGNAYGNCNLISTQGCLVGVAMEPLARANLETVLTGI